MSSEFLRNCLILLLIDLTLFQLMLCLNLISFVLFASFSGIVRHAAIFVCVTFVFLFCFYLLIVSFFHVSLGGLIAFKDTLRHSMAAATTDRTRDIL